MVLAQINPSKSEWFSPSRWRIDQGRQRVAPGRAGEAGRETTGFWKVVSKKTTEGTENH